MAQYGNKRDYRKIDLYVYSDALKRKEYVGTTTWSKTCKEARERLAALHSNLSISNISARFQ